MTAFNVVRFRVKPGAAAEFVEAHRKADPKLTGGRRFNIVDAGNDRFFIIGEWDSMESLAAARAEMISMLDSFRHVLEDLGSELGVTDPISGTSVLELKPRG